MNFTGTLPDKLKEITNKVSSPKQNNKFYDECIKAYALRLNRDYSTSIEIYNNILQEDKNNLEALNGIATCYKGLKDFDKVVEYYTRIKHLTPFDKKIHYNLGVAQYDNGNYIKAIKNFIRAIKLDSDYYDAIYALGQTHEALEEFEMAEMIYLNIIEYRPSYLMAYNRLANMYIKTEQFRQAISFFKKIICINPDFHRAYLGIAIACEHISHNKEAIRYYKKYLQMKPFSTEKKYVTDRINCLRQSTESNKRSCTYLKVIK